MSAKSIYLMHEDTPVLKFNFATAEYKVLSKMFMPYKLKDRINDMEGITDAESARSNENNRTSIIHFLSTRVMSFSRSNAKRLYNAYRLTNQNQDDYTRAKICIVCQGLSATDSYWLKPEGANRTWADVNVRTNHLSDILASVALGSVKPRPSLEGRPITPEFMGQGAYAKAWKRYQDGLYLLKKSTPNGIESETEVEVSNILDCFSVDHVKYEKDTFEGKFVCKCKNIATEDMSILDAIDFYDYCVGHNIVFEKAAKEIDPNMFYSTCVVDYLISNSDRHAGNWGFFVDNKTGRIMGMHPLFDHNNAFDEETMNSPDGGENQMMEGKSKQAAAKYAIKHCDFRCVKPVTRSMFIDIKHYKSFMSRAVELGLYKEHKKTFFEKIGLKYCEDYEPVEIDLTKKSYLREKGDIDKILVGAPVEQERNVLDELLEQAIEETDECNSKLPADERFKDEKELGDE